MNHEFPIVLTCDANYIPYTAVTLKSIICNCKTPNVKYSIYIISDYLDQEHKDILNNIAKLNSQVELFFKIINKDQFENIDSKLEQLNYISVSTFFRMEIPRLFADKYDFILYLDCDIVLANLDPYEFTQFNDQMTRYQNILAGVQDLYINKLLFDPNCGSDPLHEQFNLDYCKNVLKLNNIDQYVNAGVLYFNLKSIKNRNYVEAFSDIAAEITCPCFKDQDYLNTLSLRVGNNLLIPNVYNKYMFNVDWENKLNEKANALRGKFVNKNLYKFKYRKQLTFNTYHLSAPDYVNSLFDIKGIWHFLSSVKPWNNYLYANSFILWWAVASTLPNFKEEYVDKLLDGRLKKYDYELLKLVADKYYAI